MGSSSYQCDLINIAILLAIWIHTKYWLILWRFTLSLGHNLLMKTVVYCPNKWTLNWDELFIKHRFAHGCWRVVYLARRAVVVAMVTYDKLEKSSSATQVAAAKYCSEIVCAAWESHTHTHTPPITIPICCCCWPQRQVSSVYIRHNGGVGGNCLLSEPDDSC